MNDNIFNLNNYFFEKYGYKLESIEDLLTQKFIEYENTGANALFWVYIEEDKYLFKELPKDGEYLWLGELLSKEIADILNMPCAEYKLCKLGNKFGILSKKFTKKNETIILGAQIIQEVLDKYPWLKKDSLLEDNDFIELYNIPAAIINMNNESQQTKYLYNNLNNLEQLWSILDIYLMLHQQDNKSLNLIMNYLFQTYIFDLITLQGDRHMGNWGIIENQSSKVISIPCLFDNGTSFNLWKLKSKEKIFYNALKVYKENPNREKIKNQFISTLYKDKMLLTCSEDAITNAKAKKREHNLKVFEYFLKTSDQIYINIARTYIEKIKNVPIGRLLTKIEKEQHIEIPENIKSYVTDVMKWNLYFLEEKILEYSKEKGRGKSE